MSFDEEAWNWDKDPIKVERAKIFAQEISDYFNEKALADVMEFGCGTGLLSFELKNRFNSITLIDTSENMIKVLEEKIRNQQIKHFNPLFADLLTANLPGDSFDLIYTLLTLHHIRNLDHVLKKFYQFLKPNGYVCIADLVKEDGSFHSNVPGFDGHNGFDRSELEGILSSSGFKVKRYKIFLELKKKFDDETVRNYPLFLMFAQK
jgi:ubiquinone/menaquinone biosynthesis C-methylase UbiE